MLAEEMIHLLEDGREVARERGRGGHLLVWFSEVRAGIGLKER